MAYGHAERNLDFIRRLEAETSELLARLNELDAEQSAWLQDSAIGSTAATMPQDQQLGARRPISGRAASASRSAG